MALLNPWLSIVSVAALLFYFFTSLTVARVRTATGVLPPKMSGPPQLERALRVQGNTLEWIVIFLPAMWMCGAYFDARIAACLGVVWIAGRLAYMYGYLKDPKNRAVGFFIQAVVTGVLLLGAVAGAVIALVNPPG